MSHPSKRKGSAFEREVVEAFQERGIAAIKVPLSGAVKDGRHDCDIFVPVRGGGTEWKMECKRRARAFKTIDDMLNGNHALVVRDDRSRALVIMSLDRFVELAR